MNCNQLHSGFNAMGSSFLIQNMHLLNVQVSEFPLVPMFSISNFISRSRILPQFRTSIKTSLTINKLHSFSISSSPAPVSLCENSSNEHSFRVSYLVNTFGWPLELANSKAKHMKFKTLEKPEEVLAFFKKHGFTKTQISSIVKKFPRLLTYNPEITLSPKLAFLSSVGLSRTEITSVIAAAPMMLTRSFEKAVIPSFNFLTSLVHSHDKAVEMIKRHPRVLARVIDGEHIQILREVGVPEANIVVSLCRPFREYTPKAGNYRKIVEEVMELGFDPSSMRFLWAIQTITSMSTWEHKVNVLKKYGWSDCEILVAFEKDQSFITTSEDKIERIMDFLVNRIGVEAKTVAYWPKVFTLSFERRIVPRCLVYQVLLEKVWSKSWIGKPNIFSMVVSYTKDQFLTLVIKRYENEVPELLNLYEELLDKRK